MRSNTGALSVALLIALLGAPVPMASAQTTRAELKEAVARPVNLNTATVAELDALPGIGRKTAELIIAYRQKNGGFRKIEELMNVKGVGEKSFLKLKPRIVVVPSKQDKPVPTTD
jgi:competence protein ComEA